MTMREKIGATLCGLGLFLIIGTVGAVECGTISLTQGFVQSVASIIVMLAGAKIGDLFS